MRAIVIPMRGGPEVLALRELPDPQPGPRQVSIRVAYSSVNYIDIMAWARGYRIKHFPYVPGLEIAGYVHELGSQVEGLHVGQPVAAFVNGGGGYAELTLAEADLTIPLESEHGQLDLATAAATEGRGVDVVLDAAGEPTRSQSLSLLAPFGRMVHFGNASGNPDVPIAPGVLLAGNKGVLGHSLSNLRQDHPSHLVATARQAIDLLVAGQIHVAIAETLLLEQAALAHQLMESDTNTGKLLLQVQL